MLIKEGGLFICMCLEMTDVQTKQSQGPIQLVGQDLCMKDDTTFEFVG